MLILSFSLSQTRQSLYSLQKYHGAIIFGHGVDIATKNIEEILKSLPVIKCSTC